MSPSRPTLFDRRFWQKRRTHYIAVFKRALMLLRERGPLPEDEPNLNRELRRAVTTARLEVDPEGRFGAPIWEARNPPDPNSDTIMPHELKIPDAQWCHDDPAAQDDRHVEKYFQIECKRLGLTTSSGWNLNEEYVISGIRRFRSRKHRYGIHMAEGAMIGYVQSMGLLEVFEDVCQHADANRVSPPVLSAHGWQPRGVSELEHRFTRGFSISPFRLTHLWLDVQDIPVRPPVVPTKQAEKKKAQGTKRGRLSRKQGDSTPDSTASSR